MRWASGACGGSPAQPLLHVLPPGCVRPVLLAPHPILSGVAPAVVDASHPTVLSAAADLLATVHLHSALGLAAPQIGLPLRVFAVRRPVQRATAEVRAAAWEAAGSAGQAEHRRGRRRSGGHAEGGARPAPGSGDGRPPPPGLGGAPALPPFIACIDPCIMARGSATAVGVEACLSLPEGQALVRRHCDISVAYIDAVSGLRVEEALTGLPAVVFQHELDHLDGVLHTDREVTTFPRRSREAEWDAAQQRFLLGLMRYYGVSGGGGDALTAAPE